MIATIPKSVKKRDRKFSVRQPGGLLRIQYAIIGEILFILQNHSHQINYFGTYIISKAQISTITYKLRN